MLKGDDSYTVFTRRFDKVVRISDLPQRAAQERAWARFMDETLELRTAWEVMASQHATELRNAVPREVHADTLVTLLVDHSGSMRGERMLLAAAAVDVAREFLVHLGISVEVLGFTTRSWKGGWSRKLWRWTSRRKRPGRLCDLLHLVYAEAGDHRPGAGFRSLAHMLDPVLLKENVDGEAVLWAAGRQDECAHGRKLLILISDGAPVDDSTLHANGLDFLTNHLRSVAAQVEATRTVAQLQIGDEGDSPFSIKRRVDTLPEVGGALLNLLREALQLAPATGRAS